MILTKEIQEEIKEYCQKNIPLESCGLLLERDNNIIVFKCSNQSFYKKNSCILNPLDYVRASKLGKIVGHFHSQEDRNPSFTDYLNAINHNIFSIIYSWKYDKFYIISPEMKDYLNKDFHIGDNDCLGLIRDYYKNELNISINNYNRQENWEKSNPNYIFNNFKKEGFYTIKFEDIKKNDVILFNIHKIPQHLALFIGGNFILHHMENEKSIISELTPALIKRINVVLRHKDIKYE